MNRLEKIILPIFPDNVWLRKHWWHRLALVAAGSTTTLGLIIGIFLIFVFIGELKYYLTPFDPIKEGGTPLTQAELFAKENGIISPTTSDDFIPDAVQPTSEIPSDFKEIPSQSLDWSTLVWSVVWILMAYLIPSGIYRVFLFILTGNIWRNKPQSII